MKFTTTLDVDLTVPQLAGLFAFLDDDEQAKFFVHVAASFCGAHALDMQAHYIGRHLRDCACSTEAARAFVTSIYESMQPAAREGEPKKGGGTP